MQAVILAGGLGTRLRPVTLAIPKPMVPIAGRPFLERQIELLAGHGIQRFLLLVGYRAEQIETHLGDGASLGVQISYSREERPMGTGGALRLARGRLEEHFLLLYGDSFLPADYSRLREAFASYADGALMVVFRDDGKTTGVAPNVALAANGCVVRYEKGGRGDDLRYIEAGVVGLMAAEVDRLPADEPSSVEKQLYPTLVAEGRLRGWECREPFYDIGTPAGRARAERYFRRLARCSKEGART